MTFKMINDVQASVVNAIEDFLATWDRHGWMETHGEWASEAWDVKREDFEEAQEQVERAIAVDAEKADDTFVGFDADEAREAIEALATAAEALRGQVRPGLGDFIAEGTIDPSCLADQLNAVMPIAHRAWDAWDCREGWRAFKAGHALVMNWWRHGWGGQRHERDLWVLVDPEFFAEAE